MSSSTGYFIIIPTVWIVDTWLESLLYRLSHANVASREIAN
jgi:hypothetical protein